MRLKPGFLLRSLLVLATFLALLILWSSLSSGRIEPQPHLPRVSRACCVLSLYSATCGPPAAEGRQVPGVAMLPLVVLPRRGAPPLCRARN